MSRTPPPLHIPTLIVDAGIQGLAYAHTHRRLGPSSPLLILDANASVGGVWATENLYPGMKSNNLRNGTYEVLDFPMEKWAEESGEGIGIEEVGARDWGDGRQREGEQFGVHIPGTVMHAYLEDCVDKMGLRASLRLRTRVLGAEEVALEGKGGRKGWLVRVVDVEDGDDDGREGASKSSANRAEYEIRCDKLIVASGLCSVPRPMQIKGQETFGKPIVNFSELGRKAPALLDDDNVKHVTILGGSKAACDCVYMFASQGKRVSWIIRCTGHGPCWMSPPYVYVGPVRCRLEMLVTSRWMSWLSPCVWGDSDGFGWVRKALHNTRAERWLVDGFWTNLSMGTLKQAGYLDDDPEGRLKGLWPLGNAFGYATQLGMLNYPDDLFEYVRRGQVKVTDAWVASTGWRFDPAVKLGPAEKLAGWGIPGREYGDAQREMWGMLNEKADREIWQRFPRLKPEQGRRDGFLDEKERLLGKGAPTEDAFPARAEEVKKRPQEYSPWRLWRGIAPPSQVASGERDQVGGGHV